MTPVPATPPSRTIAAHHVRAVLRGAERAGLDVGVLLDQVGIPRGLLADDRGRAAPEQYAALVRAAWDALDDEYLGRAAVPSRRGTFATMGLLAVHCPDLGRALRRGTGFYGLFTGGPGITVGVEDRPDGRVAVLAVDVGPGDDDHFLAESLLVIWHRFAAWLVGRAVPLRAATFDYPPPAHRAEYDLVFGCPLAFDGRRTAVEMDASLLSAPVVRDEEALREFLRTSPADLLARRTEETTTSARARRVLANGLPRPAAAGSGRRVVELPGLEELAAGLAVSPQHLRRLLRAEGTSYSRIKDELRRDAAIESLTGSDEPVEALSARLGFSEPSAFHRAFRRWTGTTPGSYRGLGDWAGHDSHTAHS